MNIEEAREAVRGWIDNPLRNKWVKAKTMEAADAYALAAVEEACGLERDICEKYEKQSMVHARHADLRREIEELR